MPQVQAPDSSLSDRANHILLAKEMLELHNQYWPSKEPFPVFEIAFVVVCQGELPVTFKAADP